MATLARSLALTAALLSVAMGTTGKARAESRTTDEGALYRGASAEATFHVAEREDEAFDYASALADYRAALATLPSFRDAARARARIAMLETYGEENFESLRCLERVRRDPEAASNRAAIDALARDAEGFPEGLLRIEARMLTADAYLHRLDRPEAGKAALRRVLDDPRTDPLTRKQAAHALVDAQIEGHDLDGAAETARARGALDPELTARVVTLVRRRRVHAASWLDLALSVALSSVAMARAARRGAFGAVVSAVKRMAAPALAFAAYVALAGAALAAGYESGNTRPFLALGAALVPAATVARAWGAAGSPRAWARIGRAVISASTVAAAGFLILEAIDVGYLEAFGL